MTKILFIVSCLLLAGIAFGKSSDSVFQVSAKKGPRPCHLVNNNGWEIRLDGAWYMGLDTNATADDKKELSEVARNLVQAGICQF